MDAGSQIRIEAAGAPDQGVIILALGCRLRRCNGSGSYSGVQLSWARRYRFGKV